MKLRAVEFLFSAWVVLSFVGTGSALNGGWGWWSVIPFILGLFGHVISRIEAFETGFEAGFDRGRTHYFK